MKRYIRADARKMYDSFMQSGGRNESEDEKSLRKAMEKEAEAFDNFEDYVPSAELRRKAKEKGYKILKVRAKGAFPYYNSQM